MSDRGIGRGNNEDANQDRRRHPFGRGRFNIRGNEFPRQSPPDDGRQVIGARNEEQPHGPLPERVVRPQHLLPALRNAALYVPPPPPRGPPLLERPRAVRPQPILPAVRNAAVFVQPPPPPRGPVRHLQHLPNRQFNVQLLRPTLPNHVVYVAARHLNLVPLPMNQLPITNPNGPPPVTHRYPHMFITLPEDLPRGTVINLFHQVDKQPLAVFPVPDDITQARTIRLPIVPTDSTEETTNPNPGRSRSPQ